MDAKQLKELGNQELAINQYSDAIKTDNELIKRFSKDSIYTVQGELPKSITDSATFPEFTTYVNQTTFHSQTTLAEIKLRVDAEFVADSYNLYETLDQLVRLSRKYEELSDYEKALGIIKEIRKAYFDEPLTEDMLKKSQATGAPTEPKLTGNYVCIGFGISSSSDMVKLLEKQRNLIEAKKQYQTVLSMEKIIK
jgi:tetratricopeptide (TPR) repeat protein